MGFIKSDTLILCRISWLLFLSYELLLSPQKIYQNVFVLALGSGMSPSTGTGSEGLIAALLILLAVEDLMRLTGPQPLMNFMNVLPMRLFVMLTATAITYFLKYQPLANTPTFAFLFYDTLFNGWLFMSVRDDLNEDNKAKIRESRGFVNQL